MRLTKSFVIGGVVTVIASVSLFIHRLENAAANQIFGNMDYLSDSPYFSENAALTSGRYDWQDKSENGFIATYHLQNTDQYVYGDFNGDALQDAAVVIAEYKGGNSYWYSLAILINDGTQLVHRTSGLLGDRVIINSLREFRGKVRVDMFVHQVGDCMAGPTDHVTDVYTYEDGQRWLKAKRIYAKSMLDPIRLMLKSPSSLFDRYSWQYHFRNWSHF